MFVETWMAGGQGRAQGAYDEMVFRSMVKDDARFYDPLGLVSEGVKVDFQTEVNSYLYGTRFMSYLAHERSPEQVIEWARRGQGTKAYYASQFRKVFGRSLGDAWQDWIAWERGFQQKNLDAIRHLPAHAVTKTSRRRASARSPGAYYDAERRTLYAGLNYPGVVSHIGAISLEDGSVRKLVDIKGPRIYTVTSLAWDPGSRTLFYTSDNNALPRPLERVARHRRDSRLLIKDARIGELVFRPADRSLLGHPRAQRPRDARAHPAPLPRVAEPLHLALRRGGVRPRPLARRRARLVLARRRERAAVAARRADRDAREGRRHSAHAVRLRQRDPVELRLLSGRPPSLRQLLLHGGLERLPLRAREREARRREQHRDRLLPPDAARRATTRGVPLHRRGLRSRAHPRAAARGRQGDHVPRRSRSPKSTPSCATGSSARPPPCRSTRSSRAGAATAPSGASASSRSTPSCRATRTSRPWACARTSRTRCS